MYTRLLIQSIYRPYTALKILSNNKKSRKYAWITILGFSFLYSLTALILYLNGWTPIVESPLPINPNIYYLVQTFYTVPVGVVGVLLSYFTAKGILKIFGIKVLQQDLLGPIAFASCIPSFFTMWLVETIVAVFIKQEAWTYMTFDLIRIFGGMIWTILLTIIAVKVINETKWYHAVITGVIGSCVMGILMGTLYR